MHGRRATLPEVAGNDDPDSSRLAYVNASPPVAVDWHTTVS